MRRFLLGKVMRRRAFIALLSGTTVVGSLGAWAQQSQPPLIGVLEGASAATTASRYDAFRAALRALGYAEGVNIRFEYRYADGFLPWRRS
jgi:putative ABC transport system substrate-binding protein